MIGLVEIRLVLFYIIINFGLSNQSGFEFCGLIFFNFQIFFFDQLVQTISLLIKGLEIGLEGDFEVDVLVFSSQELSFLGLALS